MARTSDLTQEAVNEAAEQLKSQGQKPSPNRIREILGTGSFSTIKTMLDVWKDKAAEEEQIPIPSIPEVAHQLLERLHKELYLQNYQSMINERQQIEASRRDFENERAEMLSEIARLEEKNATLEQEKSEAKEQLATAQKKIDTQAEEAKQALNDLSAIREDLSAAQVQGATLKEREQQLQAQLEDKSDQLEKARQREQALENERAEKLSEITRLEDKNAALEHERNEMKALLSTTQKRLDDQAKESINLSNELRSVQVQVAALGESEKQLKGIIEDKNDQLKQAAEREKALIESKKSEEKTDKNQSYKK